LYRHNVTLAVHLEPHTSRTLSIFLFISEVDVGVAKYDVINQLSLYVVGNIAKPGELLHRCRILLLLQQTPVLVVTETPKDSETTSRMGNKRAHIIPILIMSHFRNKSWSSDDEVN